MSAAVSNGDSAKVTGILTGFSHTVPAVVRHYIGGNGTLLAGCLDYLNHIHGIHSHRTFAFGQTDSLFDNLSFFINAAAELGLRAWEHFVREFVSLFLQSAFPCQLRHLPKQIMLNF